MKTLAIDFGTSNTACAVMDGGRPRLIELEPGRDTLPTAIFLDFTAKKTVYGSQAVASLIDGREGRFMRALKSILGTSLAHEKRQFLHERLTLIDIIARFLAEIKARAEAQTGAAYARALSGRPVHFHTNDPARDARALQDLTQAYEMAGFERVDFLPEPEAAALSSPGEGMGLIVDIGGGTSDFTIFDERRNTPVIASHGVRIGGTDFDRAISLAHVMPLLGMGAALRKEMGSGTHPAPRALYHDLANWAQIPFVYGPSAERDAHRWQKLAVEPVKFARLAEVLEMHLGHDIAFAVEAGKIRANKGEPGRIDLSLVEAGLAPLLRPSDMAQDLAGFAEQIQDAAHETLRKAEMAPGDIDRIIFVGGSSLLGAVQTAMGDLLPSAEPVVSEVFTAVADGLAIAAAR